MANPAGPTEPGRRTGDRLKYAFDAGFLSGEHPPDTPATVDVGDDGDSTIPPSSDSDSSNSSGESKRLADLAAGLRVFSESLLRTELAELEMVKAREALRFEAEKRRVEGETEMTQMLLQTQLQIASFVSRKSPNRKRKRVDEDDSSTSEREGALLLSLMQCNMIY